MTYRPRSTQQLGDVITRNPHGSHSEGRASYIRAGAQAQATRTADSGRPCATAPAPAPCSG